MVEIRAPYTEAALKANLPVSKEKKLFMIRSLKIKNIIRTDKKADTAFAESFSKYLPEILAIGCIRSLSILEMLS